MAPYFEGYLMRFRGGGPGYNPYPGGTPRNAIWREGYTDASGDILWRSSNQVRIRDGVDTEDTHRGR